MSKSHFFSSDRAEILDIRLKMNALSFGIRKTNFQKISPAMYLDVVRFSHGPSLKRRSTRAPRMVGTWGSEFLDSDNTEKSGIVIHNIIQNIKPLAQVVVEIGRILREHPSKMLKKTSKSIKSHF